MKSFGHPSARRLYGLCLLSGLSGALIFPAPALAELAFIALVPYLYALLHLSRWQILKGTLIFGLTFHYLSLGWLNTLTVFHGLIPFAIPLLALILTAYTALFAFPAAWVLREARADAAIYGTAALWVGVEYLRSITDMAFPWNLLGHALAGPPRLLPLAQAASVGGVYLLSALVVVVNVTIVIVIRDLRENSHPVARRRIWIHAGVALLVTAGAFALPVWIAQPRSENRRAYPVAVVQPDISQLDKWRAGDAPPDERERLVVDIANRHLDLIDTATTGMDPPARLVVLPEAAFIDPWFVYDEPLHRILAQKATARNVHILFGADNRRPEALHRQRLARRFRLDPEDHPTTLPKLVFEPAADGRTTMVREAEPTVPLVGAWHVLPHAGLDPRNYDKVQLVPFGEMVPFVGTVPGLQEQIMMVGSFEKGAEYTIFETGGARCGVMVCFESTFAFLAREYARRGAGFLINITNDAWYDPKYLAERGGLGGALLSVPPLRVWMSGGPGQHFSHSVLRAIETGLPLVRAAQTGISAFIASDGRVLGSLPYGARGVIHEVLVLDPTPLPTIYTAMGDMPAQACLVLLLGFIAWRLPALRRRAPGSK